MNKKTLTILIIITILIAIAIGVYFGLQNVSVVLSPQPAQTGFPTTTPATGGVVGTGYDVDFEDEALPFFNVDMEDDFVKEGALQLISEKEADYFWIYNVGEEEYVFFISGNNLVKYDENGEVVVENLPRTNPYRVIQSKQGSFALVWFDSGIFLFDSQREAWIDIPYSLLSASFSPDERSIVFTHKPEGVYTVSIFDVDDVDSIRTEAQFQFTDMNVAWVTDTSLLFYPSTSYDFYGTAWVFDISTQRITKLFSGKGLDILLGSQEYLARFSSIDPLTIRIDVFNMNGLSEPQTLSLSTISSKCTFDGAVNIVCGVPYLLNKNSGIRLPDSYMQRDVYTKDEIYMFNLEDSSSNLVFVGRNVSLDVSSPVSAGGYFYFINRLDNKLYRLDISHE